MPCLREFYPGFCLTTEEKARKNLSQGKKNISWVNKNLSQNTVYVAGPKRKKTSLYAAERGGVGEGQRQCLFPRPSTVSSETDVFL